MVNPCYAMASQLLRLPPLVDCDEVLVEGKASEWYGGN